MRVVEPTLSEIGLAAVATALVATATTFWLQRRARTSPSAVDGVKPRKIHLLPSTLPVLGNLLEARRRSDDRYDWMTELSQQFDGEPYIIRIPSLNDLIVVSTPELFEEVTSTQFETFVKGNFQRKNLADLFGDGLVGADGERWYHQRKAAVKFFTARSLRTFMTHAMRENMLQVYDVFEASRETGKPVELTTLFHEFTLQTFIEIGLGVSVRCIGAKDPHPFMHAADVAPPVITRRARVPKLVWKLERLLGVGPEGRLVQAKAVLDAWVRELVEKSLDKSARRGTNSTSTDSETTSIKSVVELFAESSQEDTDGLQPEDLLDFLLTFVLAARDTTALSLTWFFYALAKHPDVEQAVRDEMASQLGSLWLDKDAYLTTDNLRHLTYFEATIKETLRLYTVIPFTRREAAQDTVLAGNIFIRKGENIGLSAYLLSRNPKVWGPDAAEFKPERWIDAKTGELITVPTSKFFTFSSGPRTCVGMNLAMMELRVVVANLLKRYHFNVDLETNDGSYVTSPFLLMKHPLLTTVTLTSTQS